MLNIKKVWKSRNSLKTRSLDFNYKHKYRINPHTTRLKYLKHNYYNNKFEVRCATDWSHVMWGRLKQIEIRSLIFQFFSIEQNLGLNFWNRNFALIWKERVNYGLKFNSFKIYKSVLRWYFFAFVYKLKIFSTGLY